MNPQLIMTLMPYLLLVASSSVVAGEIPRAFNGRDFEGWVEPANNRWWSVAEGVLQATNDPERLGSILWTVDDYGDLIMSLEFRLGTGRVDSGVFLRTDREQIQIGISGSLNRDMTASPYITGKGYPVEAKRIAELLRPVAWNQMTIVAIGKNYTVWLNGAQVMTYDSESAIDRGPIGLQVHAGREMSIEFRDIRMAELPAPIGTHRAN